MAYNQRDLLPPTTLQEARALFFPSAERLAFIQRTSQGYPVTGTPLVGQQQTNLPVGGQSRGLPSGGRSIGQPAQQPSGQPKAKSGLPVALQNIIATGSATPQMATLINTATGDRQAVAVGSAQAQIFFGQGYVLEQSPGVPTPGAISAPQPTAPTAPATPTTPTPTAPVQPSKLSLLGGEQARIRQEAFTSVYGYTPDEWQDLLPDAQRRLRNQRVQDLAGQLGDVNTAIATVKQEMETAKREEEKMYDRALTTLNSYLEYGVLDSLPEDQLSQLANATGMNVKALKQISSKKEERPQLQQLGSDLYEVVWNEDTKSYSTRLIQSGRTGTGGGGKLEPGEIKTASLAGIDFPAEFVEHYKTFIEPSLLQTPTAEVVQHEFQKWVQSKTTKPVNLTDTEAFRQDVNDGVRAVQSGTLSGAETFNRLISAYPDKIEQIRDAFFELKIETFEK